MNRYEIDFTCTCLMNSDEVAYHLVIESDKTIMAEDIERAVDEISGAALHEAIADKLAALGGTQTITATHGRVMVTTFR